MRSFFINWQDAETREWMPVAKLVEDDGLFTFGYTHGAQKSSNFLPFGSMNDLKSLYVSNALFPIFANRVMNEKRPEYANYLRWADLSVGTDPLGLMARIGGIRATDALQVFPVPELSDDGRYRTVFFTHGISHLQKTAIEAIASLMPGEGLLPMLDIQNPFDPNAVCLRTSDPARLAGYCPRYLAQDLGLLAKTKTSELSITVKKLNLDAPSQFRLLCEAVSSWPQGFVPCDTNDYKMISGIDLKQAAESYKLSNHYTGNKGRPAQSGREHPLPPTRVAS